MAADPSRDEGDKPGSLHEKGEQDDSDVTTPPATDLKYTSGLPLLITMFTINLSTLIAALDLVCTHLVLHFHRALDCLMF